MALDYKAVGRRIRTRREVLGWTQGKLARQAKCSAGFISHIERGMRIMSLETFFEIARALDGSADELLGLKKKDSDALEVAIDLLKAAEALGCERRSGQ